MPRTDPSAPADTRMMGIAHEALRRDLRRARGVLTGSPSPARAQREAVAAHLVWMMQFLHDHHVGEDEGLYPFVRERDPATTVLLDRMHADHRVVAPAIARVETEAGGYRGQDGASWHERLLAALDDLEDVLLPHLRREEDEVMPVVSATITDGEWRHIEHMHFVKPKSLAQLGREGHWLLDGLGPDERRRVTDTIPPIPRFVLLHGFARAYRRHLAACWAMPSSAPRRVQKSGQVEVVVDVAPAAVWEVVRDVTRVGEWSHECHGAVWLDGATTAEPGARFRGRNRAGAFRWGRECEIVSTEPGALTWRTVPTILFPDSTNWTISVCDDAGGGTRVQQTFEVVKAPKLLDMVYGAVIPAHRDRTQALSADLRRLGEVAARTALPTPRS
jgi:hemerythrin-like domain-containing protein